MTPHFRIVALYNHKIAYLLHFFPIRLTAILDDAIKQFGAAVQHLVPGSSVSQYVGFLACLCKVFTGNPDEYVLFLCCFPTHMRSEVEMKITSKYHVELQGEDTSKTSLKKDDQALFTLSEELTPTEETDPENTFLP